MRVLDARGVIPATRDEFGIYWFNLVHLEMVRRAWDIAAANQRGEDLDPRIPPG